MKSVRGLAALVIAPPLTLLVSAAALVALYFLRWPESRVHRFPRWWGRVICRVAGVEVAISGHEGLSHDRPYIFAANHQSQFDIFALQGYFPFDFRWLAKKELFRYPVFGPAMRKAGNIPVDRARSRAAIKSLDEAAQRIRAGASVIIFPEGTRSPDGRLQPFKGGAMVLAIKAGVEVVPLAISGTHAILPKGKLLARPGKVVIRVGQPIDPSGYTLKQKQELAELLHHKVAELLDLDP